MHACLVRMLPQATYTYVCLVHLPPQAVSTHVCLVRLPPQAACIDICLVRLPPQALVNIFMHVHLVRPSAICTHVCLDNVCRFCILLGPDPTGVPLLTRLSKPRLYKARSTLDLLLLLLPSPGTDGRLQLHGGIPQTLKPTACDYRPSISDTSQRHTKMKFIFNTPRSIRQCMLSV